ARAIATEPSVLLMDEPCSALDPIATRRIEELMVQLKQKYTIAIVTHNMQQATRVADTTAFFSVAMSKGGRTGYLLATGPTQQVSENPQEKLTKDYISGQFSWDEPRDGSPREARGIVGGPRPPAGGGRRSGGGPDGCKQGARAPRRGRHLSRAALQEVDRRF